MQCLTTLSKAATDCHFPEDEDQEQQQEQDQPASALLHLFQRARDGDEAAYHTLQAATQCSSDSTSTKLAKGYFAVLLSCCKLSFPQDQQLASQLMRSLLPWILEVQEEHLHLKKQSGCYSHVNYFLGFCFKKGYGVEADPSQAGYYFSEAACQGHPVAQNSIGLAYFKGEGVAENPTLGAFYCQESAQQGYTLAMFNCGLCFSGGLGVEKDEDMALRYFRKASCKGHAMATAAFHELNRRMQQSWLTDRYRRKHLMPTQESAAEDINENTKSCFLWA